VDECLIARSYARLHSINGQGASVQPRIKLAITGDLRSDFGLNDDISELLEGYEILRARDILDDAAVAGEVEVLVMGLELEDVGADDLLKTLTNLRWIHSMTAGVEEVISDRLLQRGVVLTNSAGCYGEAIAEYVLAGIVILFRGISELLGAKLTGSWMPHDGGREVAGSRVGIVGYGGIGRCVAELATSAGADVWAICRDPARVDAQENGSTVRVSGLDSLHEMLEVSDAVVVATSLNVSSRHMFGDREFAAMKRSAFLINVSRGGPSSKRKHCGGALESGTIAGAMIDTTVIEPLPADSKLWSVANLWITPHMAGATNESRARVISLLQWNLSCYRRGSLGEIRNVVDIARELTGR
jgi:phosphoglycerate dehydrogenase-like enzyme